jgi:hypothetical protein
MEIIDRFGDEIDEQYYTQDPSDVELHRIDDKKRHVYSDWEYGFDVLNGQ